MLFQGILQPALDMLAALEDPLSGIPPALHSLLNNNAQIAQTAVALTSLPLNSQPALGAFADPTFLQSVSSGAPFAGEAAVCYLSAVDTAVSSAMQLLENHLQVFQSFIAATYHNLQAYALVNDDPPSVNLTQGEQEYL